MNTFILEQLEYMVSNELLKTHIGTLWCRAALLCILRVGAVRSHQACHRKYPICASPQMQESNTAVPSQFMHDQVEIFYFSRILWLG